MEIRIHSDVMMVTYVKTEFPVQIPEQRTVPTVQTMAQTVPIALVESVQLTRFVPVVFQNYVHLDIIPRQRDSLFVPFVLMVPNVMQANSLHVNRDIIVTDQKIKAHQLLP